MVSTREAQTTVRLKSGERLAIGGLRQDQDLKQNTQIPVLGSIPLLGRLFGSRTSSNSTDDLVSMIRPVILEFNGDGGSSITPVDAGSNLPPGCSG